MSPQDRLDTEPADAGQTENPAGDPRILLFMRSGRNRELLEETLDDRYRVETTTDVEAMSSAFDCAIFDVPEFNRVAGTVQARRETSAPVFLPFVLLIEESATDGTSTDIWDYVDDVIELPVDREALRSRIGNLVERRQTAVALSERETQLEEVVEDLKLKERAMDEAPVGITIAEAGDGDDPLVYANEQFGEMTGYDSDVVGNDCRFLQGEATDPETRAAIRDAIDAREPVSVDILNYRKNGQTFWNKLDVAPAPDSSGEVTHFVGFQTDITDRKIRERRLEVMNRVLSHNLRNKMNVITGHADLLADEFGDGALPDQVRTIQETAAEVEALAETVRTVDHTLSGTASDDAVIDLQERLMQVVSAFEDRFPAATFDLHLPDDDLAVSASGILEAIEEVIENAVTHNESAHPTVEIRARRRPSGWIDLDIEDDGPGIPDTEIEVLREGETPLRHGDRLGLWLVYWIVSRAGGQFEVSESVQGGTQVTLSLPVAD